MFFFFFDNPTNKTVTGTAYMWGLLIANHLDQSLWSTNQKYWPAVRSNLLHSFLEVHNSVAPLISHGQLQKNQFSKLNRHILTFSQYIYNTFYCLESHTEHRWRCSEDCEFSLPRIVLRWAASQGSLIHLGP